MVIQLSFFSILVGIILGGLGYAVILDIFKEYLTRRFPEEMAEITRQIESIKTKIRQSDRLL